LRDTIYPHANTIICIEDSKLLKRFQYEILYNAKGLKATLDELNDMNFFRTYESVTPENYAERLDGLMKRTFDFIKEISPDKLVWQIFALYYDIHNMKLVAKEKLLSTRFDYLALNYGSYSMRTIRSAAVNEDDDILENETLTSGFFEALRSSDIYDVDFILDKTYFRTLKMLAGEFDIPEFVDFIIAKVDLFNFSAYFQSLSAGSPEGYFEKAFSTCGSYPLEEWKKYIDSGSTDKLKSFSLWQTYRSVWVGLDDLNEISSKMDVLVDNFLIEKTKVCKVMAFGIEPICAYFFNKFIEIKNIRILLKGKENGYSISDIKKRMRIPYEL
jgi:V/A-type H+-transporting ATPase subunit C